MIIFYLCLPYMGAKLDIHTSRLQLDAMKLPKTAWTMSDQRLQAQGL